jgi:hypothetical protein
MNTIVEKIKNYTGMLMASALMIMGMVFLYLISNKREYYREK